MWAVGIHLYNIKLPWFQVAKITIASVAAALTAHFIAVHTSSLWAILIGGSASLIVLFALFYVMRVLEPEDRSRFHVLTEMMPKSIGGPMDRVIALLIRPGFAAALPTNE